MIRTVPLLVAAAIAVAASDHYARAQERGSRAEFLETGRYQLGNVSNRLVLIDTATGQCWSRTANGSWRDEGNPTRSKAPPSRRPDRESDASLELPSTSVEMTIVQREERAIPGSDGSVRIRLGDITEGQVFLSVLTEDEDHLIERKTVSQGDSLDFSVGRKKYTVKVSDLRNILIGDDFARVTVTEAGAKSAAGKKRSQSDDHSHDHGHSDEK